MVKKRMEITLLKSFLSEAKCSSDKREYYANTYLCKVDQTNDTLLVFTICRTAYPFLKPGYSGPKGFAIDSSNIEINYPEEVLTTLDDSTLAKRYPYLVGEIRNYIED